MEQSEFQDSPIAEGDVGREAGSLYEVLASLKGGGGGIHAEVETAARMLSAGWLAEAWGSSTLALEELAATEQDVTNMGSLLRGVEFRGSECFGRLSRLLPFVAHHQWQQSQRPRSLLEGIAEAVREAITAQVPFWPVMLPPQAAQKAALAVGPSVLASLRSTAQALALHAAFSLPKSIDPHDPVTHLLSTWPRQSELLGTHLVEPAGVLLWAASASAAEQESTSNGPDAPANPFVPMLGNQAATWFSQQKLAAFFQYHEDGGGTWESHALRTVGFRHGVVSSLLVRCGSSRMLVLQLGNNLLECFPLPAETSSMVNSRAPSSQSSSSRGQKCGRQPPVASSAISIRSLLDKVSTRHTTGDEQWKPLRLLAIDEGSQIVLPLQTSGTEIQLLVMKLQPEYLWSGEQDSALKPQALHTLSLKAGITRFATPKVKATAVADAYVRDAQLLLSGARPRSDVVPSSSATFVLASNSVLFFLPQVWEMLVCLDSYLLWWRVPFPLETSAEGLAVAPDAHDDLGPAPSKTRALQEALTNGLPVHFACKLPFTATSWQLLSARAKLVALLQPVDKGPCIAILDAWYGDIVALVEVPESIYQGYSLQRSSLWLGLSGTSIAVSSNTGRAVTWSAKTLCEPLQSGAKVRVQKAVKRISMMAQLWAAEAKSMSPVLSQKPELDPRILSTAGGREGWRVLPHSDVSSKQVQATPDAKLDLPCRDCCQCLLLPTVTLWSTRRTLHAVFPKVNVQRPRVLSSPTPRGVDSPMHLSTTAEGRRPSIAADICPPPVAFRQVSVPQQGPERRRSQSPPASPRGSRRMSFAKAPDRLGGYSSRDSRGWQSSILPKTTPETGAVRWQLDALGQHEFHLLGTDANLACPLDSPVLSETGMSDPRAAVVDVLPELRRRLHGRRLQPQKAMALAAALEACTCVAEPFIEAFNADLQDLRSRLCASLQVASPFTAAPGPSGAAMLFTSLGMSTQPSATTPVLSSTDADVAAGAYDLLSATLLQGGASPAIVVALAMDASSRQLLIVLGSGANRLTWALEFWVHDGEKSWQRSSSAAAHPGCPYAPCAAMSDHGVVGFTAAQTLCGWDSDDSQMLFELQWPGQESAGHCWCSADATQMAVASSEGIFFWQDGDLAQAIDTRTVTVLAEQVGMEKGAQSSLMQSRPQEKQITSAHCCLSTELWALGAIADRHHLAVLVKVKQRSLPTAYALSDPGTSFGLASLWVTPAGLLLLGQEELQVWSIPWRTPGLVPRRKRQTQVHLRRGAAAGDSFFAGVALLAAATEEAFLGLPGRAPDSVVPLQASVQQWRSHTFSLPACTHILAYNEKSRTMLAFDKVTSVLFTVGLHSATSSARRARAPLKPQWATIYKERRAEVVVQAKFSESGAVLAIAEGWRWSIWSFKPAVCQVLLRSSDVDEVGSELASDVASMGRRGSTSGRLRADSMSCLGRRRALSSIPLDFLLRRGEPIGGPSNLPMMPAVTGRHLQPYAWWSEAAASGNMKAATPGDGEVEEQSRCHTAKKVPLTHRARPAPPLQSMRQVPTRPPSRFESARKPETARTPELVLGVPLLQGG